MRFRITGTGFYAPPDVETAEDLSPRVGRSPQWIRSRTGVDRRHVAAHRDVALLGAAAARQALGDGPPPDLLINASATPRQVIPDNAPFIQKELDLDGIASYTVHASCLSFLVGLNLAATLVNAQAQRILLVSAELATASRNFEEPESSLLLGDGAAAMMIEPPTSEDDTEILYQAMETWPEGIDFTTILSGSRRHPNLPDVQPEEHLFHMEGPKVYRIARQKVEQFLDRIWKETGLSPEDIDLVIPHQASGPALAALPKYGFPAEKVVNIIGEYGNCVAASIPMALYLALKDGRIKKGDTLLLLGTGAGLSVAAAILRW